MKRLLVLVTSCVFVAAGCGAGEPQVISLSSGWARNEGAADSTSGSLSGSAPVTMVEFALAPGVTAPARSARAWRTTAPTDATKRLEGLAQAFAISGKPVTSPDESVTIGNDRRVSSWKWGGVVSWNYDSSSAGGGDSAVSTPCDPTLGPCGDSTEPTPPDRGSPPRDLIAPADALVKARRILGAAGYGIDQTLLDAGSSDWSTWVDVETLVDGLRTGLIGRIDFGSGGTVTSAYGHFVSLSRADQYPLVDLETAVGRLAVPAFSASAARDLVTTGVVSDGESSTASSVVEITSVELALQQVVVSDKASLLVPSYRFASANGTVGTVVAVEEKFVTFNIDNNSSGTEPAPAPDTGSVPDTLAPLDQATADTLVGLTEDEATKIAIGRGWTVRVAERDGEQFMLTADYLTTRVNLSVTKGRVTAVSVG